MDYHFDSHEGDNAADGRSPETAWLDFSNINGRDLSPGDRLLLRRGSHFRQQLRVGAVGEHGAWIEITAYGEGPRPVVSDVADIPCGEIHQRGSLDTETPCVYVTEGGYLRISHLTVANAPCGLLVNNSAVDRSHIEIDDVIAWNIQNFGQEEPRVNAVGIEVAVGRGEPAEDVIVRNVTIRNSECVRTGTGLSTKSHGRSNRIHNVRMHRCTAHDNADTPWSYVGLFVSGVTGGVFEGICLDGCAPHWKPTGTAMVHYIRSDTIVFRDSYLANTQNTDSHDMGAWDFEGGGRGCEIVNCTFVDNAGPAIEFLRCENTVQEVDIHGCTFIGNDWTFWGDGYVIYTGRSGPRPNGSVRENNYVLAPHTRFINPGIFEVRDNVAYADEADLPPYVSPPKVNAGADVTTTDQEIELAGSVENADAFRWEVILADGEATVASPRNLRTRVRLGAPGEYLLRLAAENEHFIYGDYVTIRRVENLADEWIANWPGELTAETMPEPVPVKPDGTFSIACRVWLDETADGAQTILANAGGRPEADGLKLYVNRRGTRDGSLVLETGNGRRTDTACSYPEMLQSGAWHDLVVSVDCTSRDTRGAARFYLDGRDVTWQPLIRSDGRTAGELHVGRMPEPSGRDAEQTPPVELPDEIHRRDAALLQMLGAEDFTPTFFDDFSDGMKNWFEMEGEWRIEDGRLAADAKAEIRPRRKFPRDVLLVYDAWTEVEMPCDLSAVLNAMSDNGPMYGYYFGFGSDFNTGSRIARRTGTVARHDARIERGKMHHVACMRRGSHFVQVIDGRRACEYEDPIPVASGRQPFLTLYTAQDGGRFANVRVYERPVPELQSANPFAGRIADLRIYDRLIRAREAAAQSAS